MGVRLRRRFGFHDGVLTSFEDEHLDLGESLGLASDLLREEIERPRVGPMRDIVATIQPDQDDLVRADLDTSLCIQGAPGTGKTAVGLHRAAYLLYTYPERLRRSGVLVVGPERRLPALHRPGAAVARRGRHRADHGRRSWSAARRARRRRAGRARHAQGRRPDGRRAAPRGARPRRPSRPRTSLAIVGTRRYRIGAHHLRRYVDDARRALADGLRWSVARERLRMQVAEDVRRQREDAGGAPSRRRDRAGRPVDRRCASSSTRSGRRSPRRRCCRGSTTTRRSCAGARPR